MLQTLADGFLSDAPLRELLSYYTRVGVEISRRCLGADGDDDPLCSRLATRSHELTVAALRYLMSTQKLTQSQARELFQGLGRNDFAERQAAGTLEQVPLEKALTQPIRGITAP